MKNNLNYRPEIDGLRCVAVLSVIFYHFNFNFNGIRILEGGFIGVDIFYVISGYLITSIILKGLENNNFSLIAFYQRRIRRLLPALLFVIVLILPLAWLKLLPTEIINFFNSISFTSFFLSNFYFWNIGEVYGATSGVYEPLLHTWSLAVEEQFYIFYPFFIFMIFFLLKKKFNLYFLILFFFSLLFADYFSTKHSTFNFYMLPARVWELLVGALIAKNEKYISNLKINTYSNLLCSIGIFFVFTSFLIFDKNIKHPSFYTLLPVIGAGILIMFLKSSKIFKTIFSSKLFVGVGLISYSLYLWHYPLYSFFIRISSIDSSDNFNKFILFLITIFLSIMTYFFIEKPCRNKDNRFKRILILISIVILSLNIFTYIVTNKNGFKNRLELTKFQENFIFGENLKKIKSNNTKNKKEKNSKNIIVIGNSHAKDFFNILNLRKDITDDYNVNLLHIQIRCLEKAILSNFDYCLKKLDFKAQKKFQEQLQYLENSSIIILKTRWTDADIKSLKTLSKIKKFQNKKIIIVISAPEFRFKLEPEFPIAKKDDLNSLQRRLFEVSSPIEQFVILNGRIPKKNENEKLEHYYYNSLNIENLRKNNFLLFKESQAIKIKYYDVFSKVCDNSNKNCEIIYNNRKVFLDKNGHFSKAGKELISKKIGDLIY